jgi:HSP20 family protein
MLVTRFNPFREMNEFRRSFDQLNNMLTDVEGTTKDAFTSFTPAVNTREGEFAYHVEIDLPGVKKEDIEINVQDNVVTLSGERNIKNEIKKEDYYKVESEYGKFERSFSLPENTDVENIHAETADGVLEVIIPKLKTVENKPKKIEIK